MCQETDPEANQTKETRRAFLKKTTAALIALPAMRGAVPGAAIEGSAPAPGKLPWFRRVSRWGQTNITEIDPQRYDIGWWREYWRRTETQGVVLNAGGIVAYYPSQVPYHSQAEYLHGRDLFGELCRAAHEDGLAVFARMDSNRAKIECFQAHPDWFAIDANGRPHMAGDLYVTCINGPYYEEHIPAILREIIERYHPEGFTDNSWSGLDRDHPCFCKNCQRKFRDRTGKGIPRERDWDDPVFHQWIQWNYERRLEIWDLNNRVTKTGGGPDCLWVGMNSGSISGQCRSFRDYRQICRRAEMIMLDHQARSDAGGFQENGETGKLIHGLLGWDKLIPESMAMYQAGRPTFRLSSKPEPEARLWMLDGIAGGLQPWWHHVGAYQEDRRAFHTAEPIYRWHKAQERFLVNRTPIATVGVVWSQQNTDFYGRYDPGLFVELPWRGMNQALVRARIPYLPIHADEIDGANFSVLVLPNLAALSDAQVGAIRRFVERGGGLIATGHTGQFDEWGVRRRKMAFSDLFGVHPPAVSEPGSEAARRRQASGTFHTYLRLLPELRARVDGPHIKGEPVVSGERHPVLRGFEETDILPFGGLLEPLEVVPGAEVPMTFVPQFPIYPPETAWMRTPKTDIPGLVLRTAASGARLVFLVADLDRRFGRDNLPDHGNLLANLVRWAAKDGIPLAVEGPGLIDSHLYTQPGRVILHLVNLTNAGTWRQPVHELIPIGPLRVRVKLPAGMSEDRMRLLVSDKRITGRTDGGWLQFELPRLLDHEVVVLGAS